jgi:hypothetical protein
LERDERLSPQPRLLFLTLLNDVGSDRIVAAMGRLGCSCAVLGPRTAFAARSRFAGSLFTLPHVGGYWVRCLFLRSRLERIVRDWQPDLIIPLDDLSARRLRDHRFLDQASAGLRRLIEASLGRFEGYATICSRETVIDLAESIGVRTPAQRAVTTLVEAKAAATALGYPVVLKREQTCGGFGVAIVADEAALDEAFRVANWKAGTKRILQRLIGFEPPCAADLVLQRYVPGRMAFQIVACAEGTVLDSISFSAERIDPPVTGASTVLAAIDRADMDVATRTLVAALGCSGLVSLDFILSEDGASLIELNPRPVVSGHLGRLYGHDVYQALVEHWRGVAAAPLTELAAGPERIALFPRELDRDPDSPLVDAPDVLHDIPWEDLDVLEVYVAWLQHRHPTQRERLRQQLPLDGAVTAVELRRMVTSLDRYPT